MAESSDHLAKDVINVVLNRPTKFEILIDSVPTSGVSITNSCLKTARNRLISFLSVQDNKTLLTNDKVSL